MASTYIENLLKKYKNKEYGAVEYFYELVESHPEKRNKKELRELRQI